MQIIVHDVVRDGTVALDDALVDGHHVHVVGAGVRRRFFGVEFVQEIDVDFGVAFAASVGVLATR